MYFCVKIENLENQNKIHKTENFIEMYKMIIFFIKF